MKTSLSAAATRKVASRLRKASRVSPRRYPGETRRRQPVHTVYGGVHLRGERRGKFYARRMIFAAAQPTRINTASISQL